VSDIIPPISPRHRPPLSLIGEYEFQDLTVGLLAQEPDLKTPRLHGRRGQEQFGVDATAEIITGGKLAASCKCYAIASVALIKRACEEFDDHKQRWKEEDVRRFVVVVAGYAEDPKVQKEVTRQTRRYRGRKITFELWDGTTVVQKIRRDPALVHQYLRSDTWPSILCGPQHAPTGHLSSDTREAEANRLREFLAESTRHEIDSVREALRRGHRSEVHEKLAALHRNRSLWAELTPEIQASALRLRAGLALDMGKVDDAESLFSEAVTLSPGVNVVGLQTRIRLQKLGPEEALAALPPNDDDVESLCARGSLTLLLGRLDEAALVLETAYRREPKDVDAVRLLALLSIMRNDASRALKLVEESMLLAGEWEIVKRTRAVVFYLSALSSADFQNPASAMPDPIDWAFVRRDDESARRLADAAEVFRGMSEDLDRPLADRQTLEVWRLACLANLPAQQNVAAQTCAQLISKHPCNIYAVAWAIARNYSSDFDRAMAIANQNIESSPMDVGPILVVMACKVHADDYDAAREILVKYRTRFESQEQMEIWNHWWIALLLMSGDEAAALAHIQSVGSRDRHQRIEVAALLQQARKGHDSAKAKERLDELYRRTGDTHYLMMWVEQQAFEGNWTALSERATEVLGIIPTPSALYFVLMADFETRAYDRCLSRMERSRAFFPGSRLPLHVRRLRIECLGRSGRPREALREAAAMRDEDASTSTLVSFTRLCVSYGDVRTAIGAASELAERDDLLAEDAISIAELLVAHDHQLSRRLLRRANAQTLSGVFKALTLGQRLAIDREQAELYKRLETMAAQEGSPVRALKQEEVLTMTAQAEKACREILASYDNGLIPVHTAIDRCGFNVLPLICKSQSGPFRPFEQPRFFVLHGKRSGDPPRPVSSSVARLNLDITTVFLVHRFNLWARIEQVFPAIRCSHIIVPLLNKILGSIMSTAPQLEDHLREIWHLHQNGEVNVATPKAETPSDEIECSHINAGTVEGLRGLGLITETEYARAIESLPPSESHAGCAPPEFGSRVNCSRDGLLLLAASGTLGAFVKAFRVYVNQEALTSIEADISGIEERRTISESLKGLIEALGERFKTGKLQTFPEGRVGPTTGTLAQYAVADLVGFSADPGDVICADDRFINGFDHREDEMSVPIVSLSDLLGILTERGILGRQEIWQIRHELRVTNCFFIPLEPEEIAHHLIGAATRDGSVIETPELRVMRQYMAACFAQAGLLQRGTPAVGGLGEIGFAIGLRKAAVEALALLWGDRSQSDGARIIRANWIVESLYVDYPGISRALGVTKTPEEERQLVAMAAAMLMMLSIESEGPSKGNKDVRDDYSTWVWNSLFRRRCNAEPSLLHSIAKSIGLYFSEVPKMGEISGSEDAHLVTAAIVRLVDRLPEPLRTLVQEEELTKLQSLEEGMVQVLKIEDLEFEAPTYIRKVASALNEGRAEAQVLRTHEDVTIRRVQAGNWDAIDLERPLQKRVHRLRNPLWGVLLDSSSDREAALRRHRMLFDLDANAFDQLLQSILDADDPFSRFQRAAAAARCALPFFYEGLEQRIKLNEALTQGDLVPEVGSVFFRYYGDNEESAPDAVTLIAKNSSVVENLVGSIQACVRFAAIPVPLPTTIQSAFRDAVPEQQKEFLHALLRAGRSPTYRIHALRLASLAQPTSTLQRLRDWMIRQYLSTTAQDERAAFVSMLEWVAGEFDSRYAARRYDRSLRLMFAWVHASHLFATYRRARAPLEWITEVFHRPRSYQALTDLEEDLAQGRDAATPDSATPLRMAVSGLAYALSDGLPLSGEIAHVAKQQWFAASGEPHVWLWEIPAKRPNSLGSFLGADHIDDLRTILGDELVGEYGAAWRSRVREQAMLAISSGAQRRIGWICLTALYGNAPTPDEATSQIDDAFRALDFKEVAEQDRPNQDVFIVSVASRIAYVKSKETRIALVSSLIGLADWYGTHDGTNAEASGLLAVVLAFAYPAAGKPTTPPEFEKLCLNVAMKFPKFAGPCRYTVERLCYDLPTERGADYWRLALALRAIDQNS
jgi:tetratricopeptide (TPR) repeat protein